MIKAILAFLLSTIVGVIVSFFNQGMGIVLAISIIGAFIVYEIEKKDFN